MATIIDDISRTFDEFLILPGYTKKVDVPSNVDLKVPLCAHHKSEEPRASLNIPFVSSAMQSVSGSKLATSLARKGGMSFIFCSQSVESQVAMVKEVKEHKAGFVRSDSNLPPESTLKDAVVLREKSGHSTIAITEDGSPSGKLLGLLTSKDYWEFKDVLSDPVSKYYTPISKLIYGQEGITLQEATEKLWQSKKECLPIIDKHGNLYSLVFRRDYFEAKANPDQLTDKSKRLLVGAALNTHDYHERAAAVVEAGVDCLVIDSSDGYSEWQKEATVYLKNKYKDQVVIGGGNVVTREGFKFLVEEAGVDFVKVGIGGGSICITREQKGIGRGQASAVIEVAKARDEYFAKTGTYVPICSDGGLHNDTHIIVALALGADFVMMGKYFATTDESPTSKVTFEGRTYKPYWGEGSNRARNWQRYNTALKNGAMTFEEGIDAYVPYSGSLADKIGVSLAKIKGTFCNVGALSVREFQEKVILTRVSEMTLVESGTSQVYQLERTVGGRN
jgi:IMP dehydrogenase